MQRQSVMKEAADRRIPLDAVNERTLAAIDQHGWAVIMVEAEAADSFPGFAYTIGLSRVAGSEVLVIGLPPSVSRDLLNSIATAATERGSIQLGPAKDLLEGEYVLDLRNVDPQHFQSYFGRLLWFHRHFGSEPLTVAQVVLPDKAGRYPDDPALTSGEREVALHRQPLLDRV